MLLDSSAILSVARSTYNILLEKHVSMFIKKHNSKISFYSVLNNRNWVTRIISENNIIPMIPHDLSIRYYFLHRIMKCLGIPRLFHPDILQPIYKR